MDDTDTYAKNALVVIPTLNEASHITNCIRSLAQGNAAMIVVVDGGSTDGTQERVLALRDEIPDLKLISNPERVQSAGINLAVQLCAKHEHDILIRCDAHAIYPPGYVTQLCAVLREKKASSVVVVMDARGETGFARAAAWIVDTSLGNGGAVHRGGRRSGWVTHGHHAAFDLDAFRSVGGYDRFFAHNEDAEFDHRLWLAGGEIWLESDIRVTYMMRPTLIGLAKQYFLYGRGRAQMLARHKLPGRARQVVPVVNFAGQLLCVLLSPLSPTLLLWPFLYLGLCLGASVVAALMMRQFAGLWAGIALMTMHHSWAFGYLSHRTQYMLSSNKAGPRIVCRPERW